MAEIRLLLLGNEDWNIKYQIPEGLKVDFIQLFNERPEDDYDLIFVDRELVPVEVILLHECAKTYLLYFTSNAPKEGNVKTLFDLKCAKTIDDSEIQDFLLYEARFFFKKPYGEKMNHKNLAIAQGFMGTVEWDGNYSLNLEADYGVDFVQVAYWRNNFLLMKGQTLDIWLEYEKEGDVELSLKITGIVSGSISAVNKEWDFSEKDLENVVHISSESAQLMCFASVRAKGRGKIKIIALHTRHSRGKYGHFLIGGERAVTSKREESFFYFEPGDFKPPLCVYFSGYRTQEGFEGYNMMKSMKKPFLLVCEPRLEGGAFYMGDKEYEELLVEKIRYYIDKLNFKSSDVILSGLSMGTFGALYYGCDIKPHAIIVGKPLANIGNVAANEKRFRPGVFPTSLDVLKQNGGSLNEDAIEKLNNKFWDKFDSTEWTKTKFIVSYMIEDDYDGKAYNMLISHIRSEGIEIYGKGVHGRHNDNTSAIVTWFVNQYKKVIKEDFKK